MATRRLISLLAVSCLCSWSAGPAKAQQALIIQDTEPWSISAWVDELAAAGIPYGMVDSSSLGGVDFTAYDLVITVSVQGVAYNQAINARQADFEAFVQQGGALIFSVCSYSGDTPYPSPPFGGAVSHSLAEYNDIEDPSHPLVDGVAGPLWGTYVSHNYVTGLPAGVELVATDLGLGEATLYALYEGAGLLIVSGLSWEWGWQIGWNYGSILTNVIDFAWSEVSCDDLDGDGYEDTACGGTDCDDTLAAVNPGEAEVYDQLDNDCDEVVDEGALPNNALIITEVMQDPDVVSDAYGEWFEVYNNTAHDMNLIGLEVTDDGSNSFQLSSPFVVASAEYAVFGASDDTSLNGDLGVDHVYSNFSIANAEDEIVLTLGGQELDRVAYDSVGWPTGPGVAMSLDIDLYDTAFNDDPDNWCEALDVYGDGDLGTPGGANPSCCPDADGDGYLDSACGGDDCDDSDAGVHPAATEVACDDVDNDCNGDLHPQETDTDGDGWTSCDGDCEPDDSTIHPGAVEVSCDYIDNDCDGDLHDHEVDDDGDGDDECHADCDDTDAQVHPGATEIACNYIDDDCNGTLHPDEVDDDLDGRDECAGDCDDADDSIFPGNPESCDGIDNNCDGVIDEATGADADIDGFNTCQGDCDDTDPNSYPGAEEVCDGRDNDCDGLLPDEEADADGDGSMTCEGDCDDTAADVFPDNSEACDGIDNDCDDVIDEGVDEDIDDDGVNACQGDCDNENPAVYPGAEEVCDGVDNNCDDVLLDDEVDEDGDGSLVCEGDCDDADDDTYPGAFEDCQDRIDNDCDGDIDVNDDECPDPSTAADDDDESEGDGGCSCSTVGDGASSTIGVGLILGWAWSRRRR